MNLKCTISGSFRKHMEEIKCLFVAFTELQCEVLSPRNTKVVGQSEEFVLLEGDAGCSKHIQKNHFDAIRNSDFLYVVNPDGYCGNSTILEIGYAIKCDIPVFCMVYPKEPVIAEFTQVNSSPTNVLKLMIEKSVNMIHRDSSLPDLQSYVGRMVIKRGFDDETSQDVMLLLVEEIGELARAIRKSLNLKVDPKSNGHHSIGREIADCLFYLLDLSNMNEIDLISVFNEMEHENNRRVWSRAETALTPHRKSLPVDNSTH